MTKSRFTLPLVTLHRMTVFPGMVIHFDVSRPKSIAAVKKALEGDKLIFLCYQSEIQNDDPVREDLASMGTLVEIRQILNLPDGNVRILVEALHRGKLTSIVDMDTYIAAHVTRQKDVPCEDNVRAQVLVRRILHLMEQLLELYDRLSPEAVSSLLSIEDPGEMADIVAANFPLKPQLKQEILDEIRVEDRMEKLVVMLNDEINILEMEKNIMDQVQANIDQNQRDYVLHEKMRVIQEELGEDGEAESTVRKYREQMQTRQLPEDVVKKLGEELDRLLKTHPFSQEYGLIQNYIETILSLPWDKQTMDQLDLGRAKEILERDHFGLEKVKERILEYIAVRALQGTPKTNILCLVGPPGTGKTSIAKSLADALGRNYIRISLGGMQNEAEIRGHRKTYLGAMPGRVIDGLKRAGSKNPLMLFDEIDKMSRDYSGDPASAMLEVLDPEQNKNFRDHFVELPFDLSDVLFVTTANSLDTISRPLLDRMDVIELSGYTPEEKIQIAKKYLLPKQRKAHGLTAAQLKITSSAYPVLIDGYTRESGVRGLERKIAAICRKTAVKITGGDTLGISVTKRNLSDLLGKPPFHYDSVNDVDQIGVVNGLAWTESGGDTLSIEVTTMPGSGNLELTGNLGDVMKESAKTALSFVRANTLHLGIPADFYKKLDIHIHVPEGAVPKDGPSAGITIATGLASALSGRKVKRTVAMTGEITLRGRVLPIGGLKEKVLAAYRMGIKSVVIPYENKADYDELPNILKESLSFHFAKEMDAVLHEALHPAAKADQNRLASEMRYIDSIVMDTPLREGAH